MAPGFPELNQTVACRSPPSVAEAPAGGRRNRAPSDPDPAAHHRITCFLNRISSSPLTTASPPLCGTSAGKNPGALLDLRTTASTSRNPRGRSSSSACRWPCSLCWAARPPAEVAVTGSLHSCTSLPHLPCQRQSEHRRNRDGMGRTKDHSGSAAATSTPPPGHTIPPRSSSDIRGNNCIGRGSGGLLFGGVVEVTGVQR